MNSLKSIIRFLSILVVFIFVANLVIYEAILLAVGNTTSPALIAFILGAGSASFILSLFLGRNYYNTFSRLYSQLSMVWMGFFGYLFPASVLYVVLRVFTADMSHLLAQTLATIIFFVSAYGLLHAQKLIIKKVNVVLPNMPEVWKGRKAVFVSDIHVGQINGKKYVERVVKQLQNIQPDIIFIGGDLFDGSSLPEVLECITPFADIKPPQGIHFVLGNHEGYGSAEKFIKKIKEVGINVLRDEKVMIDGLQIVGVDYRTTTSRVSFKKVLEAISIDRTMPSILIKHEPRFVEVSAEAGISLQISGHTHKAQQWPYEYMARLTYGRFAYGLNTLEHTQVYTTSGTGTWGPPLRVLTDSEIVVFSFNDK